MTIQDISTLVGLLVSAWVLGFCGGYTITKYRDAMSQIG